MRYLSQREHFKSELRMKLLRKGYEEFEIDAVVQRFIDDDYLSESRAAVAYIRSRVRRGMGPEKIRADMLRLTEESMVSHYLPNSDEFWCQVLASYWKKRFDHDPEWPLDEKIIRHCLNRGFTYRLLRMMVVDYRQWNEPDDIV